MTAHTLEHLQDVLLFDERHLAVNLRELRLAVSTQVLVAETLHNLEVAVHARHHQQLLQCLRTLRQGIELPRIHAAGHNEVASTLGRTVHQDRRLYLEEALLVEVTAYLEGKLVAQLKVLANARATQVEVTILHAKVVAAITLLFNRERRRQALVQYVQLRDEYLDVARRKVLVLGIALGNLALCLDDELASQTSRLLTKLFRSIFVEGKLGNAVTVSQVNKHKSPQVVDALHPTCQGDFLSYVGEA